MTDKNDILIESFFREASRQQIADDGFTRRVMASLPDAAATRTHRLSVLWTWFCVVVGVVLFFALGGVAMVRAGFNVVVATLATNLEVLLTTAPTLDLHLNPVVLLLLVGFVVVVLPYQTARRLSAAL